MAGTALALAFVTRPPLLYAFPLIVAEALRIHSQLRPGDREPSDDEVERWRGGIFAPLRALAWLFSPGDPAVTLARLRWKPYLRALALYAVTLILGGLAVPTVFQTVIGFVTAFFFSCFAPTLFLGSDVAA
jgi:hypothetical protein